MYLVTGVTGNTGKVVAETLLAQGHAVSVVVRSSANAAPWRAKGATVFTTDLTDTAALTPLLAAAKAAYIISPPSNQSPDFLAEKSEFLAHVAEAITASKIPHIVVLSSVGAQHATGTGPIRSLHTAEQVLAHAAPSVTFLRAAYFLDNWIPSYNAGTLHNFLTPGRAVPMISTTDIGHFAAVELTRPHAGPQVIEITGPADYTPEDIAAAFGPDTQLLTHPIEAVEPTFLSFGFSPNMAALYREMIEGVNSGHVAYTGTPKRGTVTAQAALRKS